MTTRHADAASARVLLSAEADSRCRVTRAVLVTGMSGVKRRTPSVVVRERRTALLSGQQAVTALAAVIHE
jgi:hypothetical protein